MPGEEKRCGFYTLFSFSRSLEFSFESFFWGACESSSVLTNLPVVTLQVIHWIRWPAFKHSEISR